MSTNQQIKYFAEIKLSSNVKYVLMFNTLKYEFKDYF